MAHRVQFGRATPSRLSCVLFKNKSAQRSNYTRKTFHSFLMCASSRPPDLQARVSSLERSLEEERERCKLERKRRKELHNTLVVREQEIDRVPCVDQSLQVWLYLSFHDLLQELRGNIRVHCRVRPVLPFDRNQPSSCGSGWGNAWSITGNMKSYETTDVRPSNPCYFRSARCRQKKWSLPSAM